MVRRTKEEALATRHHILDTAELVFERRGVSRTSLNHIAQAAGLTRGAIYWHFDDKADLFNAMMLRVRLPMEQAEAAAASAAAPDGDPLDAVRRRFLHALSQAVTNPQVRRVFEIATNKVEYVDELLAVRDRRVATREECLASVEAAFAQAFERRLLSSPMPPRAAALGLHALIEGLIQNWMLDPSSFDLQQVGRQVLDAYLAGMAARPPRSLPAAARTTARCGGVSRAGT